MGDAARIGPLSLYVSYAVQITCDRRHGMIGGPQPPPGRKKDGNEAGGAPPGFSV
jgi:hypothetical protein